MHPFSPIPVGQFLPKYFVDTGCPGLSVPAMFTGPIDGKGFYNPGGWGPAIIANFPPLISFLVVGVVLIRRARAEANTPVVA